MKGTLLDGQHSALRSGEGRSCRVVSEFIVIKNAVKFVYYH